MICAITRLNPNVILRAYETASVAWLDACAYAPALYTRFRQCRPNVEHPRRSICEPCLCRAPIVTWLFDNMQIAIDPRRTEKPPIRGVSESLRHCLALG